MEKHLRNALRAFFRISNQVKVCKSWLGLCTFFATFQYFTSSTYHTYIISYPTPTQNNNTLSMIGKIILKLQCLRSKRLKNQKQGFLWTNLAKANPPDIIFFAESLSIPHKAGVVLVQRHLAFAALKHKN